MISRRILLAAGLFFGVAAPAAAGDIQPFTPESFAATQAAGEPAVVEIFASWCPHCQAQEKVLEKLSKEPKFSGLKMYRVDFDTQKDAMKALKVNGRSTLIVFKGGKEIDRSVGETEEPAISALLAKGL